MPTVYLSGHLKGFTDGKTEIILPGEFATIGDLLGSVWQKHPGLRDRVLNEQGEIRRHVNIYLGSDDIRRLEGLATPIDGNMLHIFNAVSGG